MKQIEYCWALLLVLITNSYETGVVLQNLAEKQRRMHHGRQGWKGLQGRASILHQPNPYTKRSVQKNLSTTSCNANSVA
jgi:hypothetical protein